MSTPNLRMAYKRQPKKGLRHSLRGGEKLPSVRDVEGKEGKKRPIRKEKKRNISTRVTGGLIYI